MTGPILQLRWLRRRTDARRLSARTSSTAAADAVAVRSSVPLGTLAGTCTRMNLADDSPRHAATRHFARPTISGTELWTTTHARITTRCGQETPPGAAASPRPGGWGSTAQGQFAGQCRVLIAAARRRRGLARHRLPGVGAGSRRGRTRRMGRSRTAARPARLWPRPSSAACSARSGSTSGVADLRASDWACGRRNRKTASSATLTSGDSARARSSLSHSDWAASGSIINGSDAKDASAAYEARCLPVIASSP